ncbi:MAG: hypothetical protein JNL29_03920 [Nitrospira sp.]|nr:hypothetical protein [Nitrospira sp.]
MKKEFVRRWDTKISQEAQMIASASRLLLVGIVLLAFSGCVSLGVIGTGSHDASDDPKAIAGYYRHQAAAMREKANAQTTAAMRYERLFGPEADLVSGARLLAGYYEQTAKELDHLAEAHTSVERDGKRPTTSP